MALALTVTVSPNHKPLHTPSSTSPSDLYHANEPVNVMPYPLWGRWKMSEWCQTQWTKWISVWQYFWGF